MIETEELEEYYIFDIPIYRCAEEKFYADVDAAITKRKSEIFTTTSISPKDAPDSFRYIEENIRKGFGGPWNFNQVIGWLKLFAESSHIGGHLWWVDVQQIRKVIFKKRFYLTTISDVLSNYFTPEDDSEAIYLGTLEDIERLSKQKPLKNRYVDVEAFRNVGPHINWRSLLNSTEN